MWESWDDLRIQYNLEDKVFFDEGGNVKRDEEQTKANDPNSRPKRKTITPKYLANFVTELRNLKLIQQRGIGS